MCVYRVIIYSITAQCQVYDFIMVVAILLINKIAPFKHLL